MSLFKPPYLRLLQALIFLLFFGYLGEAVQPQIIHRAPRTVRPTGENAIVLGQLCENPYVVAIPETAPEILMQVQQYVPSAFLTNSPLGMYIQAASFPRRLPAEGLSLQLRQRYLDARVIYRPVPCRPQRR